MPSLPITTRLDKETIEKLEKLADATKRSKSFLAAAGRPGGPRLHPLQGVPAARLGAEAAA